MEGGYDFNQEEPVLKKLRKSFAILLALCLIVSFGACDGGSGSDDPDPDPPAPATPWLCFTAGSDAATVTTEIAVEVGTVSSPLPALEYSLDGGESWNTFTVDDTSVTLPKTGDKMYIRAKSTNDVFSAWVDNSNFRIIIFAMTGSIAASGNIMSLFDKDCESTTLSCYGCFYSLFYNCISLTAAPDLPATTLAERCYADMFNGCTHLTTAPELLATILVEGCYSQMFYGCSSLTSIKVHFTDAGWGVTSATSYWVDGVNSAGTFYHTAALTDTATGISRVPANFTPETF